MVERRVRKHHAQVGRAVRNIPGNIGSGLRAQQDDGSSLGLEKFELCRSNVAVFMRHRERRHHQGEWLFFAMLTVAESRDCRGLAGVDE